MVDPQTMAIHDARWARGARVAGVWVLALVPVPLGWTRCVLATVLGVPCPTCGMTRAIRLLVTGHAGASLRMHPLAVPAALALLAFAVATVRAAMVYGSFVEVRRLPMGRAALGALAVTFAAALLLWGVRALGYAGGPVPVS